jgi:hypothetical protein
MFATKINMKRVTQTYMFPYKEDLCRFDFEVDSEYEYMCGFGRELVSATPVSVRSEDFESNELSQIRT